MAFDYTTQERKEKVDSLNLSDLPFLESPSDSEAPAKFLALTPMNVVFDKFGHYKEKNELGFYLAHEKFHLEQARHCPAFSGMIWSVVTATIDESDQKTRGQALVKSRQAMESVAYLLEGQNLIFLLGDTKWQPGVYERVVQAALLKDSSHYKGLQLFFRNADITSTNFDEHLRQLKQEAKNAGLSFREYIIGFIFGLLEVAPFLEDKDFDPDAIFEGTGWLECAKQSCRQIDSLFQEPITKEIADNVKNLLEHARTRWCSAYENNIESRVTYPYILSLMRQMHPFANYQMQFPTFFIKDRTVREGNIPGQPLGTDLPECHAIAWLYHAAAVKILQARIGAPLRCPVFEIMNGHRANCCEQEPSKGLCCTEAPEYVFLEERLKYCKFFWGMVVSLYRLLEAGGARFYKGPFDVSSPHWI